MTDQLAVRNPRTGENDAVIPVTGPQEIDKIAAHLRKHQPDWSAKDWIIGSVFFKPGGNRFWPPRMRLARP